VIFKFDEYLLNSGSRTLWRRDRLIKLQPKVMDLLIVLVENHARFVSKHELYESLWGGLHVGSASLVRLICEIRRALDDDGVDPRFIRTLHSRGYQFIGAVQRVDSAELALHP
jgi:DNA-binding winged helix-turn-helix (wHTH) protein